MPHLLVRRPLLLAALVAVGLLAAGCAAPHRLDEVDLGGRTVAVIAAVPPAGVVTGPWPMTNRQVAPPPGPIRRRYDAALRGQARLDSAAARVDVAGIVARRALVGAARTLNFRPTDDPRTADFVLDVRLLDYGFYARSFSRPIVFSAEAEVVLVERATEEVIWRRRVREREPVSPEVFGREGRRLTAGDLATLSAGEMALGLERLTALAADRIVERLEGAYVASR